MYVHVCGRRRACYIKTNATLRRSAALHAPLEESGAAPHQCPRAPVLSATGWFHVRTAFHQLDLHQLQLVVEPLQLLDERLRHSQAVLVLPCFEVQRCKHNLERLPFEHATSSIFSSLSATQGNHKTAVSTQHADRSAEAISTNVSEHIQQVRRALLSSYIDNESISPHLRNCRFSVLVHSMLSKHTATCCSRTPSILMNSVIKCLHEKRTGWGRVVRHRKGQGGTRAPEASHHPNCTPYCGGTFLEARQSGVK